MELFGQAFTWGDPEVTLALAVGAVLVLGFLLLLLTLIRAGRSARDTALMMDRMGRLNMEVQGLGQGQMQLSGAVQSVSDSATSGQMRLMETVERRLTDVQSQMQERLADNAAKSARTFAEMQERMTESLSGSSEKTTKSLTELQERLRVIDEAQANITTLSHDVLSLQDILSNKQRRGLFGETQLYDLVSKALPSDAFTWQATLSNGKRADCLVHMPQPPGPIVIDAKFPLEAFELLVAAETKEAQERALKEFGNAVRVHIKAISEKYILEGETADGALMFLPSEAIYAELHARLPQIVREGFEARVWIVSPTTCMATLNTMRAVLKDARMREQAGAIRKAVRQIKRDVEIIGERATRMSDNLRRAQDNAAGIVTASDRVGGRAERLDNFDLEQLSAEEANVVPLARSERENTT